MYILNNSIGIILIKIIITNKELNKKNKCKKNLINFITLNMEMCTKNNTMILIIKNNLRDKYMKILL